MPTPVSVARQCLTEDTARALDDAVAVARRRSHAQTTSLHVVSALLASPSSSLREACARARSSAYSSRLQFRALELCVGVSLDRLPTSKTLDEPPVSNSLMAAIRRSQANQRRNPDNFYLQQIHSNQQTASVLRVDLKHFMSSILDDPIVSRVFGEAGFRSCDIRLAVIQPPLPQSAKFSRMRCPPIFLCNLTDSEPVRPGFSFPFGGREDGDDNCRRISEVLANKNGKGKNPLLLGVCAADALKRFIEYVNRDKGIVLHSEIAGLKVISVEKEITEFVSEGTSDETKIGLLFDELDHKLEQCSGRGIVVNFGELNVLVGENVSNDAVSYLVSKLMGLLEVFGEKLWLIGAASSYETYSKFLGRFPSVGKDWDLQILPITSKSSTFGFGSKSSLMGSFVPFGGFFSTPFDFKYPLSSANQLISRCHFCTAKYEQEVTAITKMGSTISVADHCLENLPNWPQMAELDTSKAVDVIKTKDDETTFNAILGLQKKWNDICLRDHAQPFSNMNASQARPHSSIADGFRYVAEIKESSSSRDSSLNESQSANLSVAICTDLQTNFPSRQGIPILIASEAKDVNHQSKLPEEVSKCKGKEKESQWLTACPLPSVALPTDHTSISVVTAVTTDLGLGTLYASSTQEPNIPKLDHRKEHLQHCLGSRFAEFHATSKNNLYQMAHSYCSGTSSGGQFDLSDYKSVRKALAEKVGWQDEAITAICKTVCLSKAGYGRRRGSNVKGDVWLSFIGPDKVGQKRIASALAEILFGSHESLVSLDLGSHESTSSLSSIFKNQELNDYDVKFRGKTVVDYITAELSNKPHSVVFLENVDKADLLAQISLSQAVRTGKFPDSHRREISIDNMIFVMTSTFTMDKKNSLSEKKSVMFSEEIVLGAKHWQMQILTEHAAEGASKTNTTNVLVSGKATSTASSANKRKLNGTSDSMGQETNFEAKKRGHKAFRSCLDLNLPVEETEDSISYGECESDSISENSEAWLEDFFGQVDEKVEFKPFDFDALARKIMKEISIHCQRVFGSEVQLEIDYEVMTQILAASWLSDSKGAMEDWVEKVLGRGFMEAHQKYRHNGQCIVKLVTCKGLLVEEEAHGVCLPSRINL